MNENDQLKHEDLTPQDVVGQNRDKAAAAAAAWASVFTSVLALSASAWTITDLFPSKRAEKKKTVQERTTALVKELSESGIDPVMFDVLLSNEINRRMKLHFGVTFLVFTFIFTTVSYAIVILDGIHKWGISKVAIASLIIETPIQFVGLLYIIARNLFPHYTSPEIGERVRRHVPKSKPEA
jgi:hypothetical protein